MRMILNGLRERAKTGRLSGLYSHARNWKRTIRGEPLVGIVPQNPEALCLQDLLPLGPPHADHARFHFSLGLAYARVDEPANDRKGLAALRCAALLGFESTERLTLYRAELSSRLGDFTSAREALWPLDPADLTDVEDEMRVRILARGLTAPVRRVDPVSDPCPNAESILVIGDSAGWSALWAPRADYWLCDRAVNGLGPEHAAIARTEFEVGVASDEARRAAESAGVRCGRWIARELREAA
jgi:hypothetical protein